MLSRDSLIIIIVVSGLVLCIFAVVLFRALRRRTRPSVPLPPIQPLAHHRERQLAQFEGTLSRPTTWYDTAHQLTAPSSFGESPGASKTSLLGKGNDGLDTSSFRDPRDSISPSPTTQKHQIPLSLPTPSFHARPGSSSSSLDSSNDPHTNAHTFPIFPPPDSPLLSAGTASTSSPLAPPRRPRHHSNASSTHTVLSKTSRNTLRGTPHSRHSQIQIVLPTPLALENRDTNVRDGAAYDRRSIVDRWVVPLPTPQDIAEMPGR